MNYCHCELPLAADITRLYVDPLCAYRQSSKDDDLAHQFTDPMPPDSSSFALVATEPDTSLLRLEVDANLQAIEIKRWKALKP